MIFQINKSRSYIKEIYFRFWHALKIFNTRLFRLTVKTKIQLPDNFNYDETLAQPRGRKAPNGEFYSRSYDLDYEKISDSIWKEIRNFDSVLRLYFGGDYLMTKPHIWRNRGLPKNYSNLDIFSQVWHYDKVVDYRNVQLFIFLDDTTMSHGPFQYDEQSSQTHVLKDVSQRTSTTLAANKLATLTGERGDSLWFSTGSMPHRAGIPEEGLSRDMLSISFFPLYTSIGKHISTLGN